MNPSVVPGIEPEEHRTPLLLDWRPGLAVSALGPDEVRVWVVELDQGLSPGASEDALEPGPELALLSADEQARAARFVRGRDRRRFARCRVALREILAPLLGVSPGSIRFRARGQGKPELEPQSARKTGFVEPTALHFNVTHSGSLGLIGVCNGREIGVDVECVRPIEEADRIVESYFTPGELAAFASISSAQKPQAFMRGWTRKEAILKGLGVGLAGLAKHYETWFGTNDLRGCFTLTTPIAQVEGWHLWEAAPRSGYVAALAVSSPTEPAVGS
jgi:4'-phosphopantetheinyl transferase